MTTVNTLSAPKRPRAKRLVVEDAAPELPEDAPALSARRLATRRRLLEAAIPVFAELGESALIDDVLKRADLARGTFYNHFATTTELLQAVVAALGDETVVAIEHRLRDVENGAERLSFGIRLFLHMTAISPVMARFVTRVGTRSGALGELSEFHVAKDLERGRAQGHFDFEHLGAARDLMVGSTMQSVESMLAGRGTLATATGALQMALRGLGLSREDAVRVCRLRLPTLKPAPGSLLEALAAFGEQR